MCIRDRLTGKTAFEKVKILLPARMIPIEMKKKEDSLNVLSGVWFYTAVKHGPSNKKYY